jgi:predicted amidohydrolase
MKIAVVQPSSVSSALVLTEKALLSGAQLVLLPEKWVRTVEELPLKEFQRLAIKYTAYIIPGAVEDGVSIIAPIIDSKGNIKGLAKKLHLFNKEKEKLMPGTYSTIFSISGIKVGIAICYDLDFPEVIRKMVLKGAEIILVPSKISYNGIKIWREYLRVRSLENRVAIVNANVHSPPDYPGKSVIFVPHKRNDSIVDLLTLAELGEEENFAIADINPLSYFHIRLERIKEIKDFDVMELQ